MGRIRIIEPHLVYSGTHRTVDQCFLFAPNHHAENRLLAAACHPDALNPGNDFMPVPSILNIQGFATARALQLADIRLHWLESNINHYHCGMSVAPEQMQNFAPFFRNMNSGIARGVNKTHRRTGAVFAGPYRVSPCLDEASVEDRLRYSIMNVVKDGQIASLEENPFFSTFRQLAFGESQWFWGIDWDAYHLNGSKRVKTHRPKDYLYWLELKLDPLPGWEHLDVAQRQRRVQQIANDAALEIKDRRNAEKRIVAGVPALCKIDPRSRPENPAATGSQPICHTVDRQKYINYRNLMQEILCAYTPASWDYRHGDHERVFPFGTFRPPRCTLTTINTS
jgi:hypothetical protein